VPRPEAVRGAIARGLRAGGLFIAAPPDPIAFDRHEPTHIAERVPSWWVRELERAGFGVSLRFFQAPYNCELIARRSAAAPSMAFDRLGSSEPVVRASGDARLSVALRSGFGGAEADGPRVVSDGAVIPLLNRGDEPPAVQLAI